MSPKIPKLSGLTILALSATQMNADIIEKFVPFADSNTDFLQSFPAPGTPDANGWNYGYYNHTADLNGGTLGDISLYEAGDFVQFTDGQSRGAGFGLAASGDPWVNIGTGNAGHPESNPDEIWAIRRYTVGAEDPTEARLNWSLAAQNLNQTGTTMHIFRNGVLVDQGTTSTAAGVQGSYDFTDLAPGDVIDFALTPEGTDGARGDGADGSFFGGALGTAVTFETIGIVADSRTEFSGIQGANDWSYGFYAGFDNAGPDSVLNVGDFIPSGASFQAYLGGEGAGDWDGVSQFWTGSTWDSNTAAAQPWTFVDANGGHPNGTNQGDGSIEHWVTKRWTVPAGETGDLLVEFDLSKSNNAGGTTLFVLHNGEVVGKVSANNSSLQEGFVQIDGAAAGDTIDIALSPLYGTDTADGSDASQFGATIHALNTNAIPEPATSLLVVMASLGLLRRRRR